MSAQEIVWFTLAVLLVIGELMTGTFYLLMVAIGLLAGGLAALAGLGFPVQAVLAALVAVIGIAGLWRTRFGHAARENAARNRNVNLDIGEMLRVDAWSPERRARVQYAAPNGTSNWRRRHRPPAANSVSSRCAATCWSSHPNSLFHRPEVLCSSWGLSRSSSCLPPSY